MKEIIDRACDIECVTESDAKAVAALADLAVQLQSRLESLEKDAARLDWMEQVGRVSIERVREGSVKGPLRWDVEYGRYDNIAESKKSMRDAIDAAMKG